MSLNAPIKVVDTCSRFSTILLILVLPSAFWWATITKSGVALVVGNN